MSIGKSIKRAIGGSKATAKPARTKPRYRVNRLLYLPIFGGSGRREPVVIPGRDRELTGYVVTSKGTATPVTVDNPHSADRVLYPKARPPITSEADVVGRLEALGIHFELAPDGSVVSNTPRGVMIPEVAGQIREALPLIRAHLTKTPLVCSWCGESPAHPLFPEGAACDTHAVERQG